MTEIEKLKRLLAAYQIKRSVDGLNGRIWDAQVHLAAEKYIKRHDPVLTSGRCISEEFSRASFSITGLIEKAAGMI